MAEVMGPLPGPEKRVRLAVEGEREEEVNGLLARIEEKRFSFSTFPVVDEQGKLLGLLSGSVVKPRYAKRKVSEALTPRAEVFTVTEKKLGKNPIAAADKFFNDHPGIHKLLVVDDDDRLRGLFTLSAIERLTQERAAPFQPARAAPVDSASTAGREIAPKLMPEMLCSDFASYGWRAYGPIRSGFVSALLVSSGG